MMMILRWRLIRRMLLLILFVAGLLYILHCWNDQLTQVSTHSRARPVEDPHVLRTAQDERQNRNAPQGSAFGASIRDKDCTLYRRACRHLFDKLLHPNKSLIMRPPLQQPPADMMDEFTQHGEMPIRSYWYLNEAYADAAAAGEPSVATTQPVEIVPQAVIDRWRAKVRSHERLEYNDLNLMNSVMSQRARIANRSMVVIGTREVWIEALALEAGAARVTTLEYTQKQYEDKSGRLLWLHVNTFLAEAISAAKLEMFDNAVSFSSVEHSGLGRYGDPLAPNGDIEAMQQAHCMLKPDGLLFLGVPTSPDGASYIQFNAHRVYGTKRLNRIFDGWTLIEQNYKEENSFHHTVFTLAKTSAC